MPAVKNVGEPCAGEPHARFEVAAGGNEASRASTCRAAQAPLADPTNPALWSAGDRVPVNAILGENADLKERLHQPKDAPIPDSTPHPFLKGRVRDLIEARRDVCLENPLVIASGCPEVVNLGDRVLSPTSRTEAVAARLEVRLEDRLEHQLQHGLHDSVGGGRDPQATQLPRRLGNQLLPHPAGGVPAGLQIVSNALQELPAARLDGPRSDPIDAG